MTTTTNKPPKHNWMKGFVIPPPQTPEDRLAQERAVRCRAIWDGNNKYRVKQNGD